MANNQHLQLTSPTAVASSVIFRRGRSRHSSGSLFLLSSSGIACGFELVCSILGLRLTFHQHWNINEEMYYSVKKNG
jgi:hypothetical protein